MGRKIIEACGVSTLCEDPCRKNHKRVVNEKTEEVFICPAFYKYYIDKRKIEKGRFGKKVDVFVKVELK